MSWNFLIPSRKHEHNRSALIRHIHTSTYKTSKHPHQINASISHQHNHKHTSTQSSMHLHINSSTHQQINTSTHQHINTSAQSSTHQRNYQHNTSTHQHINTVINTSTHQPININTSTSTHQHMSTLTQSSTHQHHNTSVINTSHMTDCVDVLMMCWWVGVLHCVDHCVDDYVGDCVDVLMCWCWCVDVLMLKQSRRNGMNLSELWTLHSEESFLSRLHRPIGLDFASLNAKVSAKCRSERRVGVDFEASPGTILCSHWERRVKAVNVPVAKERIANFRKLNRRKSDNPYHHDHSKTKK